MKKIIRVVFLSVASVVCFCLPAVSQADSQENGVYTMNYTVYENGKNSESVANQYFNKPAQVTVNNGQYTIQLQMNHASWITDFNVGSNNVFVSSDTAKDTRIVQFQTNTLSSKLNAQIKVDIEQVGLSYHHNYTIQLGFDQVSAVKKASTPTFTVYRLYNPNSGEHFYTQDANERNGLINLGWRNENIGWYAKESGVPVYRAYNPNSGEHHYTINDAEVQSLVHAGWAAEGIAFYSANQSDVPVYRVYNPNARNAGSHHYTPNKIEADNLVKAGWRSEGISFYSF